MQIFVFGNPDLEIDALPVRMIPALQKIFPNVTFTTLDPNEEWEVPEHMLIIDTVVNISELTTFTDLNAFMDAPRMTCHDFDAYSNLMFMKKLGKIQGATIIGIPPGKKEDEVLPGLIQTLHTELDKKH